jgi:hypothetical protein
VPNNPASVRGIFATDNNDVGAAGYSTYPWDFMLKPPDDVEDVDGDIGL